MGCPVPGRDKWLNPFSHDAFTACGKAPFVSAVCGAPVWFKAGAQVPFGRSRSYLDSSSLVHVRFIPLILACRVILMDVVGADCANSGPLGENRDPFQPGEVFHPLGLADTFAGSKVKGIKNARWAMSSVLKKVRRTSPCHCSGSTAYCRSFHLLPRDTHCPRSHQCFHAYQSPISEFRKCPTNTPLGNPWQWKPKYVIQQFKLREVLGTEALGSINT